jgi:hypothetical protein
MNYEKVRGEIDVCLQVDELISTNKIEYRPLLSWDMPTTILFAL